MLRRPFVTVMQPAEAPLRNDRRARAFWRRSQPATRCLFGEPEVRAIVVVVGHVLGEHPTEMALVQHDDVVEQLAAHAADPAFGYAVLPGAAVRRPLRRDAE